MAKPIKLSKEQERLWDRFWSEYPRKDGKNLARQAFGKLIQSGEDPEFLIRAAIRHAAHCRSKGTDAMFIPYGSTWLNQRRFEDDHLKDPPEPAPGQEVHPGDLSPLWGLFEAVGMDRGTFTTWIAPLGITHTLSGRVLELAAPSAFHRDWLINRLEPEIRKALGGMPTITLKETAHG